MSAYSAKVQTKEKLSSVTTFSKCNAILEASRFGPIIHVRQSGVNDLIAAEGKYHNTCYQKFRRTTSKTEKDVGEEAGVAMEWLITELKDAAKKSHVLELARSFFSIYTCIYIYFFYLKKHRYFEIEIMKNISHVIFFQRSRRACF
jgi:hypothetical protein